MAGEKERKRTRIASELFLPKDLPGPGMRRRSLDGAGGALLLVEADEASPAGGPAEKQEAGQPPLPLVLQPTHFDHDRGLAAWPPQHVQRLQVGPAVAQIIFQPDVEGRQRQERPAVRDQQGKGVLDRFGDLRARR